MVPVIMSYLGTEPVLSTLNIYINDPFNDRPLLSIEYIRQKNIYKVEVYVREHHRFAKTYYATNPIVFIKKPKRILPIIEGSFNLTSEFERTKIELLSGPHKWTWSCNITTDKEKFNNICEMMADFNGSI